MTGCMDHVLNEAIEIWLHSDNFHTVVGFTVKSYVVPGHLTSHS